MVSSLALLIYRILHRIIGRIKLYGGQHVPQKIMQIELKKSTYDSGFIGCNFAVGASHGAAFFYLPKLLRLKEKAGNALTANKLGIFWKHFSHTSVSRLRPSFKPALIVYFFAGVFNA